LKTEVEIGCDEIQVLTGTVEFHLGQYKKAMSLFEAAVDTLVRALGEPLGERHEIVADTLQRLGVVEECLWEHEAALDRLNRALDIQTDLVGKDGNAPLKQD